MRGGPAISGCIHQECNRTALDRSRRLSHSPRWPRDMPTVLRHGRWRFFFYSNEGSEPAHVHVESAGRTAKFWLTPVALVGSNRVRPDELRAIERFVKQHRTSLLEAWNDHFRR